MRFNFTRIDSARTVPEVTLTPTLELSINAITLRLQTFDKPIILYFIVISFYFIATTVFTKQPRGHSTTWLAFCCRRCHLLSSSLLLWSLSGSTTLPKWALHYWTTSENVPISSQVLVGNHCRRTPQHEKTFGLINLGYLGWTQSKREQSICGNGMYQYPVHIVTLSSQWRLSLVAATQDSTKTHYVSTNASYKLAIIMVDVVWNSVVV